MPGPFSSTQTQYVIHNIIHEFSIVITIVCRRNVTSARRFPSTKVGIIDEAVSIFHGVVLHDDFACLFTEILRLFNRMVAVFARLSTDVLRVHQLLCSPTSSVSI